MKFKLLITILFITALAVAACSPQAPTAPAQTQAPAATQTPAATQAPAATASSGTTVNVGKSDSLGMFLVDAKGMTLYLFLKDTPNTSNCYDACATSWPPLLTDGSPVAGDSLDAAKLGTTARTDGTTQVTYNSWPLYYFAKDKLPGDTTGQDVKQVWYVISPAGDKVVALTSSSSDNTGYGSNSSETATPMSAMPTDDKGGHGSDDSKVTEGSNVSATIENFGFNPGVLTVHEGTTVTWTNNDGASHTVTSDSGAFDSGPIRNGANFSFTFSDTGTFTYHCKFHSDMTASVVVLP
jgi:predicted lipoprotein with Yx(FWY)xxD motif/plastocyanin